MAPLEVQRQAALSTLRLSHVTAINALATGALLVGGAYHIHAPLLPAFLWFAALVGVLALRLGMDARFRRTPSDALYRRWMLWCTWQQAGLGLLWAALPWMPGSSSAPSHDLLVMATLPVAVGVLIGHAAQARAGIVSTGLFSVSFTVFLLTRGDSHHALLGIFCAVMSGVQSFMALYLQRLIFNMTRLRLSNEALLASSEAQRRTAADSAAYLQEVLDCLEYGVSVYDSALRLKFWNQELLKNDILPPDMVRVGVPMRDLVHNGVQCGYYGATDSVEDLTESIVGNLQEHYDRGGGSWTLARTDGRRFKVRATVLSNGDLLISSDDVTDIHEAMDEELKHVSRHCELTGLLNRTAFRRDLEMLLHAATADDHRVAIQLLDIDSFRSINSALGADVGDQVLQTVAGRIRNCAPENTLIGRLGDEFAIAFCGNLSKEDIMSHCADIVQESQARMTVGGHSVALTVSAGVAIYPDQGRDASQLMDKVALAQKAAKTGDKGRLCLYSDSMGGEDEERNSLRTEMWRALVQKEFMLYFQPQIDLASGEVVGAETLLRWLHPELGWVPPGKFIPVAETSQQIVEITEWLLPAACREARTWIGRGWTDLVVSVNISAVHFHTGDLVDLVYRSLVESGLPAQNLELELTESVLLPNADHVETILTDLGDLGVRLAIDDFGTGYSAMSYLRRFPMQKLKIDGSFVRELNSEPESRSIVEAIAQVGHTLGNYVVAEGVETLEQLDILGDIGCDGVQGYLYSKPLPADQFATWVEQHKAKSAKPPSPLVRPRK